MDEVNQNNSRLGLGVMINMLSGNQESRIAMQAAIGKKIKSLELKDNELIIRFMEGNGIILRDDGQSCCERRYMVIDDDLNSFKGSTIQGVEVRDAPSEGGEDDVHEVQFLVVITDNGNITAANHNEHNGYYGGFSITASLILD